MTETERLDRAGQFVLGRMGNIERERAERDLARDPNFRAAVMKMAISVRDRPVPMARNENADRCWRDVAQSLAALPHMRDLTWDRQLLLVTGVANDAGVARGAPRFSAARYGTAVLAALMVIFGLGYQVGRTSTAADFGQVVAAVDVTLP